MTSTPSYPNLVTYDRTKIDLQSDSATRTPNFIFRSPEDPSDGRSSSPPIILLDCRNPFATCLHIKSWLLEKHSIPAYSAPGILRMDHQELDKIDLTREGWMIVSPDAATLDPSGWVDINNEGGVILSVSIIAILVKSDPRIRWFYTLFPISSLLARLDEVDDNLITPRVVLEHDRSSYKYTRMRSFVREEFTAAIRMPDSPDWVNAQKLSDFCPSILDPDRAVSRLEEESWLYWNTPKPEEFLLSDGTATGNTATAAAAPSSSKDKNSKDHHHQQDKSLAGLTSLKPTDDRYVLHLHPAERELASLARLKCAEYLFIKRNFFHAFWTEIYRSDKLLDAVAPVSTSNPVASRRVDPAGERQESAVGRQDTPVSTTSTPAPSSRFDSPAPTQTSAAAPARGRGVGYDASRRNRVRTERAHQVWLEQEYKMRTTAARALVIGWRVLGFLEEARFVGWVKEGWGGDVEDEDGDGNEG